MSESTTYHSPLARWWSRLEILLAVALLAACVLHTGQMMRAMATTSLWTDEFGTVGTFSSKGPGRVLTDYRTAKNHVFFNLLNSILPGRDSFHPARVRLLSLAAAGVFLVALVAYAIWRRALFEGSVVLTLWTFAPDSLRLCLEGRGYGFLALAGLISALGVAEYFRSGRRGWYYAAAGAVVLGTYTVPGFIFYGGPLLVVAWLVRRDWWTFLVGAGAAVAIGLLYVPVLTQIVAVFTGYGDQYGQDFKDPQSLMRALDMYLLRAPFGALWVLFGVLAVAPFLAVIRHPQRRGWAVVMVAALAFFGALLYLKTSPIRMSNMGWVPFALAGVFSLGALLRAGPLALRIICFSAVAVGLGWHIAPEVRRFEFTPHEDWVLAGQVTDRVFPAPMKVEYLRYAKYLLYTIQNPKERSAKFDEAAYLAGDIVVVDAANRRATEFSLGQQFLRPAGESHTGQIVLSAGSRDYYYTFQLPKSAGLQAPAELIDRSTETGLTVAAAPILLPAQKLVAGGESIVVLVQGDASHLTGKLRDAASGEEIPAEVIEAENALILTVPGEKGEIREVTLELSGNDPELSVREVWSTAKP